MSVRELASGAVVGSLSTERTIREALQGQENTVEEGFGSTVSVGDTSLRADDIEMKAGGASKLGKGALGSASLMAALTLHPCLHLSGCGDASEMVLHSMFSMVGPCKVQLDSREESGLLGEASVTFENAAMAVAAIERFDGSRFNDGYMFVSVARTAAQGSFTRRGRSERMTFYDKQQERLSNARMQQVESEKAAFASARAKMAETAPQQIPASQTASALFSSASGAKRKQGAVSKLPSCLIASKRSAVSSAPDASSKALVAASTHDKPSFSGRATSLATTDALTGSASEASTGADCQKGDNEGGANGLLGLGDYGSSDSESVDQERRECL